MSNKSKTELQDWVTGKKEMSSDELNIVIKDLQSKAAGSLRKLSKTMIGGPIDKKPKSDYPSPARQIQSLTKSIQNLLSVGDVVRVNKKADTLEFSPAEDSIANRRVCGLVVKISWGERYPFEVKFDDGLSTRVRPYRTC